MNAALLRLLLLPLLCCAPATAATALCDEIPDPLRNWAFQSGVAFITDDTAGNVLLGRTSIAKGPAGGRVYLLSAAYRLGEPTWQLANHTFKPLLELPLTLAVVDENARSPFLNYATSFQVRWRDLPWNAWLSTTMATGLGLAYSDQIFRMDHETHAGCYRSHVKFNWPIELTLALPQFPQHQLTAFIMHQSGGCIFDRGGINNFGFGYRYGL
ncbi:MAG: hypothetical protein DVB25_03060 [Verrucomicrobia bacterium]|nr:MAG: hypothetical protein DVB25_03060 [Verrucomicrobiota bacterium]